MAMVCALIFKRTGPICEFCLARLWE